MRLSATSAQGETVRAMVLPYPATHDCASLLVIYAGVLIEIPAGRTPEVPPSVGDSIGLSE
jgi:hypothetical protein